MVRVRLSERCRNTSSPSERTITIESTADDTQCHDANANVSAIVCTVPRFRGYSTQRRLFPQTLNTAQYPSPRAARCSIYSHLQRYTDDHMVRVLYILYIHITITTAIFQGNNLAHTHRPTDTSRAGVSVSLLPSLPSTPSMHAPALLTSFLNPTTTIHHPPFTVPCSP